MARKPRFLLSLAENSVLLHTFSDCKLCSPSVNGDDDDDDEKDGKMEMVMTVTAVIKDGFLNIFWVICDY